ncbi:MAG: hypothetical protein IJ662_09070 [Clostridia bacterium]|nr:hypothetical protein [Clostridia bacterium]
MACVTLPGIFRDGMVLQRQKPICVWGEAEGADTVRVSLAQSSAVAEVIDGRWRAYLPPMQAATGLTMTVCAQGEAVTLNDVAVGEVWLAGGQSNMEFQLRFDAEHETACRVRNPDIRCFEVPKRAFAGQEKERDLHYAGIWRKAGPGDSEYFTAVGFYFACRLWDTLRVPVGVINCTWGGTSASAWVDESCLTGELAFFLDRAKEARAQIDPQTEREEYRKIQQSVDAMPPMMGVINDQPIFPDEGMKATMAHMDRYNLCAYSPFRPSGLYHAMLQTIVPYTLRGVIWYQGESDEYFGSRFEPLTRALIQNWRALWQEELPFLMVQLAAFEYMVEPLDFVPMRRMQHKIAGDTPHVHLICAMDVGLRYDIHPKEKRPVGDRLALQALHHVYGLALMSDSPSLYAARRKGNTIAITFRDGDGLWVKGDAPGRIDLTVDGQDTAEFTACVKDDQLLLTSDLFAGAGSVTVRFAWRPFCDDNVYNRAGLPVLPFEVTVTEE